MLVLPFKTLTWGSMDWYEFNFIRPWHVSSYIAKHLIGWYNRVSSILGLGPVGMRHYHQYLIVLMGKQDWGRCRHQVSLEPGMYWLSWLLPALRMGRTNWNNHFFYFFLFILVLTVLNCLGHRIPSQHHIVRGVNRDKACYQDLNPC